MKKTAIERIRSFERFGTVLGLERMNTLMELLGNPQDELKCIHVAGTNGKGSVCRVLYEAIRANSYKVGIFTSPYIEKFNERMEFDGECINDEELEIYTDRVLEQVKAMELRGLDLPTEFEIVTAIAFLWFKERNAEFVILEVGLGGRGDSTNIIKDPLMTVITSISHDHMDRLGNTLAEIAAEKAGIIKPGVPVVMNVKTEDRAAEKVIARTAYEKGCVLHDVSKIKCGNERFDMDGTTFDAFVYGTSYGDVDITMLGSHQVQNTLTAITVLELLRKAYVIQVRRDILYDGIKKAFQKCRFEVLKWNTGEFGEKIGPFVILDGAHNEAGAKACVETIKKWMPDKKIKIVCGMLADKDASGVVKQFATVCDDFIATEPSNARKLTATDLCHIIQAEGKSCIIKESIGDAVMAGMEAYESGQCDAIIFTGSLYLVGKVRGMIVNGYSGN